MSLVKSESNDEENKLANLWKHYLYELQLKAPKPKRVVCKRHIPDRPPHYGREFHGRITREEANELIKEEDGRYLVRESIRALQNFTLALRLIYKINLIITFNFYIADFKFN